MNGLRGGCNRIDDEIINLALLFRLHEFIGIERAVGTITARNLTLVSQPGHGWSVGLAAALAVAFGALSWGMARKGVPGWTLFVTGAALTVDGRPFDGVGGWDPYRDWDAGRG